MITEKQQKFIASLATQTGAYDSAEGMIVGMRLYPHLSIEAAIEGECSKKTASQIISLLLEAPRAKVDTTTPTAKQLAYLAALAEKAGQEINVEGMTRREVSAKIDELKTAAAAA